MRAKWNYLHGFTNVWAKSQLSGIERIKLKKDDGRSMRFVHLNQKPLELMELQIKATTAVGDVVWEPFGGLGSATVAAILLGRNAYYAEVDEQYYEITKDRCASCQQELFAEVV